LPGSPTVPGPVVSGGNGGASGHGEHFASAFLVDDLSITGAHEATLEGVLYTPRERANGVDDHPG
jgi:hypothetical protein